MNGRLPHEIERPKDHVFGEAEADAAVVEYGDYGCPDCRRLQDVLREVYDSSGKPLKYVFRHFPLASSGENRLDRAIAAEAAARQGKFWEMHEALFRHAEEAHAIELSADDAQLDKEKFDLDRSDPVIAEEVEQDIEEARAHGIDRVPTLFIRGKEYQGAWDADSIQEAIRPPLAGRVRELSLEFAKWAAASSVVLIAFSVIAMLWRNSAWGESYEHLWHIEVGLTAAGRSLVMSAHHWVNDLLMAVFFLVVGLELKREIMTGELADAKRAALPVAAAIGGMVVPAGIFLLFNYGTDNSTGWGVPMATDIAFTLGVLALLGTSVPSSLKVFATALAIADDLGAILVLAVAYNHGISWTALGWVAGLLLALFALNRARVYVLWPYLTLGVGLWAAVYFSGLHATLAGVLLSATIPTRRKAPLLPMLAQGSIGFEQAMRNVQSDERYESIERDRVSKRTRAVLDRLHPPAERLEHALQPWSAYLVLPIFALSNAGIAISAGSFRPTDPLTLGIVLGLVIGKPLGIFLGSYAVDKLRIGKKPENASWSQMFGVACLCGIGFTMSIFIANEAFTTPEQLETAKLSVMIASVLAAISGFMFLRRASQNNDGHVARVARNSDSPSTSELPASSATVNHTKCRLNA